MKKPELPPTTDELRRASTDLFYAAHQSAIYVYWLLVQKPVNAALDTIGISGASTYFSNSLIEASLLFIRKSAEFFKPQDSSDKPDTIFAYRYFPGRSFQWIIPKEGLYKELHKRVGHISIQEARYGKMSWPLPQLTRDTVDHWTSFFRDLPTSPIFKDVTDNYPFDSYVQSLEDVLHGCDAILKARKK